MNTLIKTTVLTTALLATSPLFANTSTSGQVSGSAEVSTQNSGLLKNLSQGVHHTADRVGAGIEKGVDKTREVSKNTWEGTKQAGHSVGNGVQNTATHVGHGIENGVEKTKEFTKEKWQNTKEFSTEKTDATKEKTQSLKEKAAETSDKAKRVTQDKWNKTKEALTPATNHADAKTNSNLKVNTPVGNVEAGVNTEGRIGTQ